MNRRRILLVLSLAAVAAGVAVFWPRGPKEPVYQGKRLSKWIKEAHGESELRMEPLSRQARQTARKAIRSIGTNALPFLLSELTGPISQWRVSFNRWAEGKTMVPFRFRDEEQRIWQAADGLHFLGPDSAPALPVLAGCLADPQRGFAAAHAMSGAGELAVPYLLPAIAATDLTTARKALGALGDIAKENESAVPILVQFVTHTNSSIRQWAASHLAVVESHTDLTVPVLTAALSDPEWAVRHYAANALGGIGPKAKAAVPELLRLMKQTPSSATLAASNALFHIDPTTLPPREP
jgi:hypothetical protein